MGAEALIPLYKQKRVCIVGALVLGAFVALIVIFLIVGNQSTASPGTKALFNPSPSSAPSSITTQSPSESLPPTASEWPTQSPSNMPSIASSPVPTQSPSVSMRPTTSQYQMQRRGALMALYDATNGDEWREKSNWLSD